jgi:hypothetical protein
MSRETERGHRGELTDVEGGERSGSKAAGTAVEPAGRLGFLPRRRTDGPPATGRGSLDSRASPGSGGLLRRCFVAANRVAAGERARRSGARLDGEAGRDGAASRARGRPALGFCRGVEVPLAWYARQERRRRRPWPACSGCWAQMSLAGWSGWSPRARPG